MVLSVSTGNVPILKESVESTSSVLQRDVGKNRETLAMFNARCEEYQKIPGNILARAPSISEKGKDLITYVNAEQGVKEESRLQIEDDHVILRKPDIIHREGSKEYYNEWLVRQDTFEKTYQVKHSISENFSTFSTKSKTVFAMKIEQDFLDCLHTTPGLDQGTIEVPSWGAGQTQQIFLHGYLLRNDLGHGQYEFYGVSARDMSNYQRKVTAD